MTPSTTIFENVPCSRCGGSGHYSFNLMHGSTCYGCGGRGWQHTKRGAAASAFLNKRVTVPASELQVGDKVWGEGITLGGGLYHRWMKVLAIDLEKNVVTMLDGKEPTQCQGFTEFRRKFRTNEEKDAIVAEALAYQETLTKAGEPRKRKGQ